MNTNRRAMLAAVAGVVAGFAAVLALVQWRAARASEDELRLATEKYVTLQAQLREWETKARDVTRRAADAERDTAELLKAVESARLRSAANPGNASVTDSGVSAGTLMASATSGPAPTEEEQQRLAQERKFQQELAKVRAEQAKDRAAFESAAATAEPAKKFQLAMERVKWLADKAEFQAAIRTFNAAMAEKPAEFRCQTTSARCKRCYRSRTRPLKSR